MCFFLTFFFVLRQPINNVTMFPVNNKGTQPYINIYPFSPKLSSHPDFQITLSRVPWQLPKTLKEKSQSMYFPGCFLQSLLPSSLDNCQFYAFMPLSRNHKIRNILLRKDDLYLLRQKDSTKMQLVPYLCHPSKPSH